VPSKSRPPDRRRRRGKKQRRSLPRPNARVLAAGLLLLVGLLYVRPLTTYFHTRAEVGKRAAEVRRLRAEHDTLRAGFQHSSQTLLLAREARQLSLVRPGEQLYVVSGIERWRRSHRTAR
jgi:cell division protein FtsB